MEDAQRLENECVKFSLYLTGLKPNSYVLDKYIKAHEIGNITNNKSFFDRFILSLATVNTFFTRMVDVYTSFFYKNALVRRKMILLLAILESCEPSYSHIDRVSSKNKLILFIKFLQHGVVSILCLFIAIIILMPLHIFINIISR